MLKQRSIRFGSAVVFFLFLLSGCATDWIQLTAGSDYTCAVKSDGRLFCWGNGRNGVHDGSDSNVLVPVQERTAAADWEKVSVGRFYTCAIKTDGRLFCWGHNNNGELGDNTTSDSPEPVQESTASTDWDDVSAGGPGLQYPEVALEGHPARVRWARGAPGGVKFAQKVA